MATLYFVANSLNYLVVAPGNRSELTIGYFTKYGDGGVDLLPIGGPPEERRPRAREGARRAGANHREGAERRAVAGSDRRGGDGLHVRRSRTYLTQGPSAVSPALAHAHRASRSRQRSQATPLAPAPGRAQPAPTPGVHVRSGRVAGSSAACLHGSPARRRRAALHVLLQHRVRTGFEPMQFALQSP